MTNRYCLARSLVRSHTRRGSRSLREARKRLGTDQRDTGSGSKVKLSTSEGEEFEVESDVAVRSVLIKNMLEGEAGLPRVRRILALGGRAG